MLKKVRRKPYFAPLVIICSMLGPGEPQMRKVASVNVSQLCQFIHRLAANNGADGAALHFPFFKRRVERFAGEAGRVKLPAMVEVDEGEVGRRTFFQATGRHMDDVGG